MNQNFVSLIMNFKKKKIAKTRRLLSDYLLVSINSLKLPFLTDSFYKVELCFLAITSGRIFLLFKKICKIYSKIKSSNLKVRIY